MSLLGRLAPHHTRVDDVGKKLWVTPPIDRRAGDATKEEDASHRRRGRGGGVRGREAAPHLTQALGGEDEDEEYEEEEDEHGDKQQRR